MRVLVVGAGAVGGYFGGRLFEKGADVTFLVRPKRQEQLNREGLILKSVHGDATLAVPTITYGQSTKPFDLIILSVKAYHLTDVLTSLDPYVSSNTAILPLLNGFAHFPILQERYGKEKILGGLCVIESTVNAKGHIEQYSPFHDLVYGEWSGQASKRMDQMADLFSGVACNVTQSPQIGLDVWKKYVFISTMSGMTSLTRSSIGTIWNTPTGEQTYRKLAQEIIQIAQSQEPQLDFDEVYQQVMKRSLHLHESMKSSMSRDIEKGQPIETDHFHGYLLGVKPEQMEAPTLETVYTALSAYQATRGE
ncbi:ketopantoate reductase family protein [Baia soyae]|uniref:2-dehydropantoate 2-reductase n=1 Tax=Baia soyae TaxID=1544746 RepID=A0A4R2SEF2_9BACL|nr:ketopantoate reductase family protein [Baia soyae]TCP69483.1 ketopantoate reductase [Baia soyae]